METLTLSFTTEIEALIQQQRAYFFAGNTLPIAARKAALQRLATTIKRREADILAAIDADFRKAPVEGYGSEVGAILAEIKHSLRGLGGWAKPERVRGSLLNFPSRDEIRREPYGCTLIIGAWNYPFHLTLMPLIGAVAAGNCVVLKPSELAAASSAVLQAIVAEAFEPAHVTAIEGDAAIAAKLLEQRFDYVFYTGSTRVGQIVMEAAAKHLTPVTLELGGKSPCIVLDDANIAVAARRIAWGKFLNAGQTCIAPDYILVPQQLREPLVAELIRAIEDFYGKQPIESPDFCRIINDRHFNRVAALFADANIAYGGETDRAQRYISPTLLTDVSWDDAVMQEEIFGPVLPIISYTDIQTAIQAVRLREKPLACYIFSESNQRVNQLLDSLSFGGGCVNDTIVHLLNNRLPFGGVGGSGIGAYHGRHSFETFSHRKSIVRKPTWLDIPLRYAPYAGKMGLWKRFLG